jgi:hypothetical protein
VEGGQRGSCTKAAKKVPAQEAAKKVPAQEAAKKVLAQALFLGETIQNHIRLINSRSIVAPLMHHQSSKLHLSQ